MNVWRHRDVLQTIPQTGKNKIAQFQGYHDITKVESKRRAFKMITFVRYSNKNAIGIRTISAILSFSAEPRERIQTCA